MHTKNAIKEYKKSLRLKKRSSWKDFYGEIDGMQPSARLNGILFKDDDYKMGAFRLPSEAFTSTDQEVAEHLLETHFSECQLISGPQSQSQPITPDWLIASSVITEEKIIHIGNKTDVDICHISLVEKNTSDHCKETVWSYLADYRLYEHHTYGSNGDLPGSTTSATCG
jgi:hypothetical protein